MKHFTTHSIAIVAALILAGGMAITAQTLKSGYDDSSDYLDSKKHNKWHTSQNFKKALSILNNESEEEDIDYEKAIDFLEDEVKQHPTNGYAVCNTAIATFSEDDNDLKLFILGLLFSDQYQMEEAKGVIEKRYAQSSQVKKEAVAMLEKGMAMIPAADKENLCKAYITYGNLQNELENTDGAIAAYEQAATLLPCYQSYDKLMKCYLEQDNREKALYYASALGNLIDDDNEALRMLAQVHIDNKNYNEAEKLINKAIGNSGTDTDAYQLLINLLITEGRYQDALDKTIEYSDYLQGDLMQNLIGIASINEDCKNMVISRLQKLNAEASMSGNDEENEGAMWGYFEGLIYNLNSDYRNALTCFDQLLEHLHSAALLSLKANCHYMLGDAPQALKILKYALRMPTDSEDNGIKESLLSNIIRIEMLCGMTDEQIYDSQLYCKAFAEESFLGYEGLARGYFNSGQYAKALEVCNDWIEQSDNNIEARYMHAYVLYLWGKTDEAREEMQEIINDENCDDERKMFALLYMGKTEESRVLLDKMARSSEFAVDSAAKIETSGDAMTFYNLACAYSQHGEIDRALYFLERFYAEDNNATDFDYAILDDELNNARKDPRFMEIINRYKQQWLNGGMNLRNNGK